jgi:hypothetical protein
MRTGSPGAKWTKRKTMMETPIKSGIICKRRLIKYRNIMPLSFTKPKIQDTRG